MCFFRGGGAASFAIAPSGTWPSYATANTSLATDGVITPGYSSIPDGISGSDLLIPIISDGIPESAEYFCVQLTNISTNIGRHALSQLNEEFIVRDSNSAYGLIEWKEIGHTISLNHRTLMLLLVRREGLEFNILVNYNVTYVPAGSGTEHQLLDYVTTPGFTAIQVSNVNEISSLVILIRL